MRTWHKFIGIFLITCGLYACIPMVTPAPTPSSTQALSQLHAWNLNGAIAVTTAQQTFSANLNWEQNKDNYILRLWGPLGMHALSLTGNFSSAHLETADGIKASASTPEQLLRQETGWQLPISNLYFWIRGLPASRADYQWDKSHQTLSQQGWTIHYIKYHRVSNLVLPQKIIMNNAKLKIKIIIRQWELAS